jgi:type II secretory pathway pseudopilin PulG
MSINKKNSNRTVYFSKEKKMKTISKSSKKRAGFTIIELLTVMSIIIILISLLIPSLNALRRYGYYVKQKNQFHGIDVALEFFNAEWEGYPDSGPLDIATQSYCGAMKLCEALMGQDLLGFNPESRFYQVGTTDGLAPSGDIPSNAGNDLYPGRRPLSPNIINASRKERKELFLPIENAGACKMEEIYLKAEVEAKFGAETGTLPVLCDVYPTTINRRTGKNIGMPVLYYKADSNKKNHPTPKAPVPPWNSWTFADIDTIGFTYDYRDNQNLVDLGLPMYPTGLYNHNMSLNAGITPDGDTVEGPDRFYIETWNKNVVISTGRSYRADSYILMSAGFDGIYGTKDDVFNFEL